MTKKEEQKFFEELFKIRDLHYANPAFAKLLAKYNLPFSTRQAIKILKKII